MKYRGVTISASPLDAAIRMLARIDGLSEYRIDHNGRR